jgi:mRNA-degrading endonuclease RelE of RelBE toxin-antitoxin system
MYKVSITSSAERDLKRLDRPVKNRGRFRHSGARL